MLAEPGGGDDVLEEATILLSNAAHFFVYLEGNRKYLDEEALLPWREVLLDGRGVRQAVLEKLSTLRCADPEAERLRCRWTARLRELVDADDPDLVLRERKLCSSVEQTLHLISCDRAALLARLGTDPGRHAPEAVFFRVISGTGSPATRTKLARAWDRQRDRRADDLVDLVDKMVDLRRMRARKAGHETPLGGTLTRSAISAEEAESFVLEYLGKAVAGHERLGSEIRSVTGCINDPMNHFAYYLRGLTVGVQLPELPLQECLDVAVAVAEGTSGCTLRPDRVGDPHAMTLSVRSSGRLVGQIQVDLVGCPDSRGAQQAPVATLPTGRALCRYRLGPGGQRMLTFDGAHSLFHEFGHAITQVLVGHRRPGPSGLEYLPVERLEDLSEWYEKWVYHPDFTARVSPTAEAARGLATSRRVKLLEFLGTHLQRAVVAALDLDVHGRSHGGLRESFDRLDEKFGIGRHCDLGDLSGYFTRPMFRSNPGMGLVYLWGYAYGAERCTPFLDRPIKELPASGAATGTLASCFDPDLPSERPDVDAVFRFYERGLDGSAA